VALLGACSGTEPAADPPPVAADDPPVTFPKVDWPWYAQGEISVHPEPPIPHRPAHVCAEVVNHTSTPQDVVLEFGWLVMAKVTLPLVLLSTTGSSCSVAARHCAVTRGSPFMPNWAMNFSITRKKRTSVHPTSCSVCARTKRPTAAFQPVTSCRETWRNGLFRWWTS